MNEKHFVVLLSLFNGVLLNDYKLEDKRILISKKVVQEQARNYKNQKLSPFHENDENHFFARRIKRNKRLGRICFVVITMLKFSIYFCNIFE